MLYTICTCLFVLFGLVGFMTVCYILLLLFMKPKNRRKRIVLLPMYDNDRENAGRIGYTVERLNLFGEDSFSEIWAVKKDGSNHKSVEEMFEQYNSVKFMQIGEMPFLLSQLWD